MTQPRMEQRILAAALHAPTPLLQDHLLVPVDGKEFAKGFNNSSFWPLEYLSMILN